MRAVVRVGSGAVDGGWIQGSHAFHAADARASNEVETLQDGSHCMVYHRLAVVSAVGDTCVVYHLFK